MSETIIVNEQVSTVVVVDDTSTITATSPGPQGATGATGAGVPAGGATGQVLKKNSNADYDTSWQAPGAAPTAAQVDFTPAGNIAATDVQAAVEELDTEKAALASAVMDGDSAGGVLSGTYPNPSFASDMATQAELDAHINNITDAHDASAISILDTANDFTATDVEGALAELQSDAEADAQALSDHLADTTDAHAGSAITNTPAGNIAATTVQGAINELDSEKAALASAVMDGDAAGGVLAGTYPNPSFASDMATQAELDALGLADLADVTGGPPNTGEAPVWDGDSFELIDVATQAELDVVDNALSAHEAASPAHAGADISIADAGNYFTGTNVEAALQEIGGAGAGYQPLDSDLTAIAALSPTNDDIIQRKAGAWTNRTMAQLASDLGLASTYQPLDSDLTAIAALSTTTFGRALLALVDPADATKFLDGTGAYDTVKDSDLSTSDITTNNVSTSKHGFAPKAPNDATKFLDGTGAYSTPAGAGTDGWTAAGETWSYASSTTFTVSGVDVTAKYRKGTRIRLKQGGSYKYFVVASSSFSTNTTVTVTAGSDNTIANSAITDNYFSYQACPQGYPSYFNYSATLVGFSGTPTQNCQFSVDSSGLVHFYVQITGTSNATSLTVSLPIQAAATNGHNAVTGSMLIADNGTTQAAPGFGRVQTNATVLEIFRTATFGNWTSSGTKTGFGEIFYWI